MKLQRNKSTPAWMGAYKNLSDLAVYGDNALGIFAIGIKFGIDDYASAASDSITDGSGDKKCDVVYINKELRIAIIAQCYWSTKKRSEAPANKASDLNTAVNWLLLSAEKELPERIKYHAIALREAIRLKEVDEINIWYVHNNTESVNCQRELSAAERSLKSIMKSHYSDHDVTIRSCEVGESTLDAWYTETVSPILVTDTVEFKGPKGYEMSGKGWSAYMTCIKGSILFELYEQHKNRLFSANVREFLGRRNSDGNINNGIATTAKDNPEDFWILNNGITIIVNDYKVTPLRSTANVKCSLTGISIVNGAQTTGAIGSLANRPEDSLLISARIVKATGRETIFDIIRYNNSQNKVTASDFRSTDSIQKRLKEEVSQIPDCVYEGGRRGLTPEYMTRRGKEYLSSYTVGQAIAAVHGDPVIAYNQKSEIWVSDRLYSKYFPDEITGKHLVFCYSLLKAIESHKADLMAKMKTTPDDVTTEQADMISFYRKRGAVFLMCAAIGLSLEIVLGGKIHAQYKVMFKGDGRYVKAIETWRPIIDSLSPLYGSLDESMSDGLKSSEKVKEGVKRFAALVSATSSSNRDIYSKFKQSVVVS